MRFTKKFGKERAEINFKRLSRTKNMDDLKRATLKSDYGTKMGKEIRPFHEGYRDRLCELLKVKKSDYKLPWEK